MNHQSEFQIKTRKQLLDEQILQEKGKFQFGILWTKETDELLSRSLARASNATKIDKWLQPSGVRR